jgi:putative ABC transport system permease protein
MSLLRLITLPYVRKHSLRCLLTLVGIMLGVAVFVAMHTANQSVLAGFRNTVVRIAGRAQLQVSAGEAGFEEEVLDRVRNTPGVERAAPVIEAVVQTGLQGEGNLLILAVDMVGDAGLRDYTLESGGQEVVDDPLVFLAQPDSLILTRDFAERNRLQSNSKLLMQTMEGQKEFTVRGLLRPSGMTSAYGGNLAIMDIYAAQQVFGRGHRFDRIDVVVAEAAGVERTQESLRRVLGPALSVELPDRRGQNFEALLAGYSAVVNTMSVFALFIGMFVVYNSFAVAVTQRRTEIGTLRALGASRDQIRNLFLLESAVAGVLGAAGGVWIGLGMARLLTGITTGVATAVSGIEQNPEKTVISGGLLVAAAAMGLITTMVAAWIPARSAAQAEPVLALQKGRQQSISSGENRLRSRIAMATGAVSAVCFFWGSDALLYAGFGLVAVTAVLLAPALSYRLARVLRVPLRFVRPVEGMLAADSLLQAPRRTSATVAALMLSLAVAVAMAGAAQATIVSIKEWTDTAFNADLLVLTSDSLSSRSFHFPASMQAQLEAMPGIDEVQPVRSVRFPVHGSPVMIIGLKIEEAARRTPSRHVVAGDFQDMHRRAAEGQGLIVSENLALLQKMKLGDVLELAAPAGTLRLPVVGVFRDFSNQTGSIYMDLAVFRRYWKDDSLDMLHVYLRPGVDPVEAKSRILARFESQRRLFVYLNGDVRRFVLNVGNQWFGLTYMQIGVAVLVAVLGIVNTLTVSILDRRRELGILRAVGGMRNQIRGTLWLEAMTMAFMGVVLGLSLGGISLFYQLETLRRSILATPLGYIFPTSLALALFPIMLLVAFLSALAPAEAALRGSLVKALEYE